MDGYPSKAGLQEDVVIGGLDRVPGEWEDLLRQILSDIGHKGAGEKTPGENKRRKEIIFDVHVNGARYTLTRSDPQPARVSVNLSPREQEIVRLVAKGLPNKAISDVLEISPWTVATHLRRVFTKLGVSCRAEMVARVMKEGLLGNLQ